MFYSQLIEEIRQVSAIPDHLEGDLITGSKNTHIATLVGRHSRFTMLVKIWDEDTTSVASTFSEQVRAPIIDVRLGHGDGAHKNFTIATDVQVYFCDP